MLQMLGAVFQERTAATVGIEEEVMLLDPATLDLMPGAAEVVAAAAHAGIGPELPAAQIELRTAPHLDVPAAVRESGALRLRAVAAAAGIGRLAAAGAHPFAAAEGPLRAEGRYGLLQAEYGPIARRQLIGALHVHVALRPAERALGVHNAIRSYLPLLAALAANCPFHAGRDSGLASVRPLIAQQLPRQGVPPPMESLDELAGEYSWGRRAGALPGEQADSGAGWWWEARPNPRYGTLEIRVPDAQTTVAETAGVAAAVHALCVYLARRYDEGALSRPAPTWRIEHNRWRACRFGLDAELADLDTGQCRPARAVWHGLLCELAPVAADLGCTAELASLRDRLDRPTVAARHRAIAARAGTRALTDLLAARFTAGLAGSCATSKECA